MKKPVRPAPDPESVAGSITALGDNELALVAGGEQFVFKGEGFKRDSWFVTFMTKLLIQGSIRQEFGRSLDETPQEITVEGRRYRVSRMGGTIYVEELA